MVRRILLTLVVLALVIAGTLFTLDRLSLKQSEEVNNNIEQEAEKTKYGNSNRTITRIVNPDNPNDIKMQWTGMDGLTYKLEAVKNDDGTYTGSLKGLNMYDGFIEYNFKFDGLSQSGFDQLFYK